MTKAVASVAASALAKNKSAEELLRARLEPFGSSRVNVIHCSVVHRSKSTAVVLPPLTMTPTRSPDRAW